MRTFITAVLLTTLAMGTVLAQALFFSSGSGTAPAGWQSHALVTFPAATGGTQTNITLAWSGSDTKLKVVGSGGQIQHTITRLGQTVPADLVVTSDSTCATITGYSWGIEQYSGTAGTITGWIKVPSLTTGAAVTPTICVGNTGVSTWQGGSAGAEYDASTKETYHLSESALGTGAIAYDFSASANNLTVASTNGIQIGSAVAGKIGGAVYLPNAAGNVFNGASASSSSVTGVGTSNNWTVSAWIKLNVLSVSDSVQNIVGATNGAYPSNGFGMPMDAGSKAGAWTYDPLGDNYPSPALVASNLSATTWYHIVSTYDGTTLTVYQNGTSSGTSPISFTRLGDAIVVLNGSVRYQDIVIDEARIDSVTRPVSWIATTYANQNSVPVLATL